VLPPVESRQLLGLVARRLLGEVTIRSRAIAFVHGVGRKAMSRGGYVGFRTLTQKAVEALPTPPPTWLHSRPENGASNQRLDAAPEVTRKLAIR
jgi:hypothetical protein